MVQITQAMLHALCITLFKHDGDGRFKPNFVRSVQCVAQFLELYTDPPSRGKTALNRALAEILQNAAVGQSTAYCLPELAVSAPSWCYPVPPSATQCHPVPLETGTSSRRYPRQVCHTAWSRASRGMTQ